MQLIWARDKPLTKCAYASIAWNTAANVTKNSRTKRRDRRPRDSALLGHLTTKTRPPAVQAEVTSAVRIDMNALPCANHPNRHGESTFHCRVSNVAIAGTVV